MHFYVYVLLNLDDEIYIGQTDDLTKRHYQHNEPANDLSKHTKRYPGPWRLIHAESLPTRSDALRREQALKSSRGRAWIRETFMVLKAGGC